MNNTGVINTSQKRRVFKEKFGEILIPRGFVFKKNRFVRIHPGIALLIVEMDVTKTTSYIEFNCLPMCINFQRNTGIAHCRVDSFFTEEQSHYAYQNYNDFDMRFHDQYSVFVNDLFTAFDSVHDRATMHHFRTIMQAKYPSAYFNMLVCVQCEKYEEAYKYAQMYKQYHVEAKESMNRFYLEKQTYSSMTKEDREDHANYILSCDMSIQEANKWQKRIENKEYNKMQKIIEENCKISDDLCRKAYPEFYK